MLLSMKITSILILTITWANAEAPPGYVKQAEPADKNPPKYEYGYNIEDEKGGSHGKLETRDGIYALGRYYVQGVDSTHNVQYYADDWGYHPFIEYGNVGPHSRTKTQLLLGVEAVKALASNKFTPNSVQPKQHVTDTITTKLANGRDGKSVSQPQESKPLQIVVEGPQQPQQIIVQQPQLVTEQHYVPVQQQQIVVEQSHQGSTIQQPQQIPIGQTEQINNIQQSEQSQEIASDQSDSIVVEARGRQQQFIQEQQQQQQQQQIGILQQLQQSHAQQTVPQQLQQIAIQQTEPLNEIQQNQQYQEIAADQSDSIVVEARGRQQHLLQEQQQQHLIQEQQQQQQHLIQEQQQQQQHLIQKQQQQQQHLIQEQQQQQQQLGILQQLQQSHAQQTIPQQLQQISIQQNEQSNNIQQNEQYQETAADQSDSIVVEARGRQQQSIQNEQPQQQLSILQQLQQNDAQQTVRQPQQVLLRISQQQTQNVPQQNVGQPQLEQAQIGQETHQFSQQLSFEQLPQPQALISQSGGALQQNNNQIQENLIFNQQFSQLDTPNFLEQRSQQTLQDSQLSAGNFGSRLNLQGKNEPTYDVQAQTSTDRLIANTRNLVSGQNVLEINRALDQSSFEATTAKALASNENLLGISTVTESNLLNGPIVVADFDDKLIASTEGYKNLQQAREQIYSTTASTIETLSTKSFGVTEPSTIVVTPRPVSTNFLAPITAGIQLQNVERNRIETQKSKNNQNVAARTGENSRRKENFVVEVQKSLPFYLGKFEYEQNPSAVGSIERIAASTTQSPTIREKAIENIELGKTLALPEFRLEGYSNIQQNGNPQPEHRSNNVPLEQQSDGFFQQQLEEASVKPNCADADQQGAQGIQHQVAVQQISSPLVIEKVVEKQVAVPIVQTKIVEKPVQVTKIVREPYPVGVPVHVPVQVEKRIPVPVTVEKVVEKPVKVTEVVEKRIHVPQPYPVEKIVEKPVHVPYEVTKYVDRPYPVQVPVAQPVPYPVDRVVEKIVKQPYPVAVNVPVEVKVPYPVEKIVEKKVPVPQYIEKRVPVDRIVEKLVPQYIDRPYPVQVGVPVPVAQVYALQFPTKVSHGPPLTTLSAPQPQQTYPGPTKTIKDYQQQQPLLQQLLRQQLTRQGQNQNQPQLKQNILAQSSLSSNEYLPPQANSARPHDCDQVSSFNSKNVYYTIQPDDYIGLAPPRLGEDDVNVPRKFRNARSNFNTNLRIEYGFKPPLRPSQEIDENGKPIIREEA